MAKISSFEVLLCSFFVFLGLLIDIVPLQEVPEEFPQMGHSFRGQQEPLDPPPLTDAAKGLLHMGLVQSLRRHR